MFQSSRIAAFGCLLLAANLLISGDGAANAQASIQGQPRTVFTPYTGCRLPNGLDVVETSPLAPGIHSRTVKTLHGPFDVSIIEGRRIMFAYPDETFYANVKVEVLPVDGYAESRAALIDDFDGIVAGNGNSRNYKLSSQLNGFRIQGLDRDKREGGVLGIYLFFDDPNHTVTTIYFLNQEPPKRFTTMDQYAMWRDRFLNDYTACIRHSV